MFRKHRALLLAGLIALVWLAFGSSANATQQTVGLFQHDPGSFDGYTLFAPLAYPTTYLIDNEGRLVHSWQTGKAFGAYLQEDGTLIEPTVVPVSNPEFFNGGATGRVTKFAWDGTILWQYVYSNAEHTAHHDISVLPNGHVLMLAWEVKTYDEAIAAGRDPSLLWQGDLLSETIIEVAPTGPTTGDIVWKWDVWDHLIQDFDASKSNYLTVADHPELVDINFTDPALLGARDWLHANALTYNPQFDQILVSIRNTSEFWVIDHSTTTAEAAEHSGGTSGKGGDVMYRWGNPASYRAGTAADRQSFYQHNVHWIPSGFPGAGDILFYNNGPRPDGVYSTLTEITPPVDGNGNYALTPGQAYGPAAPAWSYTAPTPTDFYSQFISSADRMSNGNTVVDAGVPGIFFEVTSDGTMVWKYVNPVGPRGPVVQGQTPTGNAVFHAHRYPGNYPGLIGQDLTPGDPLETDTDGDGLSDLAESGYYHTNASQADTDGDGCSDGREVGPDQTQGGLRDPLNPWDFYDVNGDKMVDLFSDIFTVAGAFGLTTSDPGYSTALDRSPPAPGADLWELGPPDGTVDLFSDVFGAAYQFGHSCA